MTYRPSKAPIAEELYSPLHQAVKAEKYYGDELQGFKAHGKHLSASVTETCAEIDFASTIVGHAASYLSPDDLQEVAEPMITRCAAHCEQVVTTYEDYQPLPYKRERLTPLYLSQPLLRQMILFKAMCSYPPDNEAAAKARHNLAQEARATSGAMLPKFFAAYEFGKRAAKNEAEREIFSSAVQESAILALINMPGDANCVALPGLDASNHAHKIDASLVTYELEGSFVYHLQSKSHSLASSHISSDRRRNLADQLTCQAVIHPALLGDAYAISKRKGMHKTWTTTKALIEEGIQGVNWSGEISAGEAYLTQKRAEVLDCIREEAVAFPLRLWHIPARHKA